MRLPLATLAAGLLSIGFASPARADDPWEEYRERLEDLREDREDYFEDLADQRRDALRNYTRYRYPGFGKPYNAWAYNLPYARNQWNRTPYSGNYGYYGNYGWNRNYGQYPYGYGRYGNRYGYGSQFRGYYGNHGAYRYPYGYPYRR